MRTHKAISNDSSRNSSFNRFHATKIILSAKLKHKDETYFDPAKGLSKYIDRVITVHAIVV